MGLTLTEATILAQAITEVTRDRWEDLTVSIWSRTYALDAVDYRVWVEEMDGYNGEALYSLDDWASFAECHYRPPDRRTLAEKMASLTADIRARQVRGG